MPHIDIAHLREQGQDIIIAPLDGSFGRQSSAQQNATINEIQAAATSAGLAGLISRPSSHYIFQTQGCIDGIFTLCIAHNSR